MSPYVFLFRSSPQSPFLFGGDAGIRVAARHPDTPHHCSDIRAIAEAIPALRCLPRSCLPYLLLSPSPLGSQYGLPPYCPPQPTVNSLRVSPLESISNDYSTYIYTLRAPLNIHFLQIHCRILGSGTRWPGNEMAGRGYGVAGPFGIMDAPGTREHG